MYEPTAAKIVMAIGVKIENLIIADCHAIGEGANRAAVCFCYKLMNVKKKIESLTQE